MAEATGYNPYENREVEHPLTNFDAFFSLLKCVIGTGILAMPWAFHLGGFIGGTVMTIICTALLIYGIQLLIMCMVESSRQSKVGYMTFPKTMEFAFSVGPSCCRYFAKASGYLVDGILGFSHYGVNVVYVVFVAVNIKQFADENMAEIHLRLWCGIIGILCLPLFLLRYLKYLVPGNIIATFMILFGLIAIFNYLLRDLPGIGDREMFPTDVLSVPTFMGIVMFATSSVGVMLAIESKMATPEKYLGWFGVLNIAAVFVVIINVLFAWFGYWRYGHFVSPSVTLNIPDKEVLAQVIKLFIAIAVFLTYPLSGFVTIDIIVNHYLNKNGELKNPHMVEYIVRVIFVIVSTLNAMAFPNLGPLLALVGAFSISLLNLIFPCIIELCLLYHDSYGKLKWKLWKNILIIIFGLFVLGYGSYAAIKDMIDQYGSNDDDLRNLRM